MTITTRRASALALALTLVCALPSKAAAQDTSITTVSGDTYNCVVLSDDGKRLMIRTDDGMEMGIPYANLTPATLYQIELGRTAADDAPGQLKLGDAAMAAELWSSAKKHYHNAVDVDASLEKTVDARLAKLRQVASDWLMTKAKQELQRGRQDTAEQHLSMILSQFPQEKAAAEAQTMLASLHQKQTADRKATAAATQSKEVQQALAPAEKMLDESKTAVRNGLANSSDQSRSIDDFKKAAQLGKDGRDHLNQLKNQAKSDQDLASAITELDSALVAQIVNADIQLATAYNARTSYNDATNAVNAGLALDPKNAQLLALRTQIAANNSNSGSAYGPWYGRRGRR